MSLSIKFHHIILQIKKYFNIGRYQHYKIKPGNLYIKLKENEPVNHKVLGNLCVHSPH